MLLAQGRLGSPVAQHGPRDPDDEHRHDQGHAHVLAVLREMDADMLREAGCVLGGDAATVLALSPSTACRRSGMEVAPKASRTSMTARSAPTPGLLVHLGCARAKQLTGSGQDRRALPTSGAHLPVRAADRGPGHRQPHHGRSPP